MTNKELWAKEFKRITRIAKGLTKGTNIEFVFPKQPKRIEKKSIERLRKITPATIREIIAEQKEQTQKQKVQIEIAKAARVKEPEEPKKGYRYQAITPEERSRRAKKAAATRAAKGIKPFGEATPEELSERAKKGAATRAAKGVKPFGGEASAEARSARAKKAAATRKARGITPFGNMTPEQRSARAKKAAATRRENRLKRLNGDKVDIIDEETGEISTEEMTEEEVPNVEQWTLIIENYLAEFALAQMMTPYGYYGSEILMKLEQFRAQFGEKATAKMLIQMAEENILVTPQVLYNYNHKGEKYVASMAHYFLDKGLMEAREVEAIYNNAGDAESYFDYSGAEEDESEYFNRTYVWTGSDY